MHRQQSSEKDGEDDGGPSSTSEGRVLDLQSWECMLVGCVRVVAKPSPTHWPRVSAGSEQKQEQKHAYDVHNHREEPEVTG